MSVGEIKQRVISVYSADITDQISKLGKIEDAEKKLAGTRKKGTDDAIKQLADLGHAMGTLGKIGSGIWSAYESSMEQAKLANASMGISIDNLAKASGGLQTRMELMNFAAKMSHSAFALSESQMITATKAIRELTREGYNQEEATKKVTDALLKLSGDSLKDLGIRVRENTTDAGKFNAIMDSLGGKAKQLHGETRTASEEMKAFGTTTTDAFDSIKSSIGRLVSAMGPLLKQVGWIVEKAAGALEHSAGSDGWDIILGATGASWVGDDIAKAKRAGQIANPAAAIASGWLGLNVPGAVNPAGDGIARTPTASGPTFDWGAVGRGFAEMTKNGLAQLKLAPESAHAIAKAIVEADLRQGNRFSKDNESSVSDLETWRSGESEKESAQFWGGLKNYVTDFEGVMTTAMTSIAGNAVSVMDGIPKGPTALEKMFGTLTDIDGYKVASSALTASVTAGYDAMVDGSQSFRKAFQTSIADSLKALGGKLSVAAIAETAEGLASLAIGPIGGVSAGHHFASAAMFSAGAVAAGVAAHSLGTSAMASSANASSSSGSSGGSSGRGSGGSGDNRPIIIVAGDDFTRKTDRMRAIDARRLIDQGLLQAGYTPGGE